MSFAKQFFSKRQNFALPDVLNGLLTVIVWLTLSILPVQMLVAERRGILYLLLAAVAAMHWLNRTLVSRFSLFLGFTILLLLFPFLLPKLPDLAIGTTRFDAATIQMIAPHGIAWIAAIAMAVQSLVVRLTDERQPGASLGGQIMITLLFVALQAAGLLLQRPDISQAAFLLAAATLLIILLRWQLLATRRQWQHLEAVSTQPVNQVRRFSLILLAVYSVPLIALFSAATFLNVDRLLVLIGVVLRELVRWFLWLLSKIPFGPELEPSANKPPQNGMQLPDQGDPPPQWLQLIWQILEVIAIVVVIASLAAALVALAIRIYRRFYERERLNRVIPTGGHDEVTNLLRTERKRRPIRIHMPFRRSADEKIRRQFIRLIRAKLGRKAVIPASATARSLGLEAGLCPTTDLISVTSLYEKARYSNEPLTDADVSLMARLVRDQLKAG